MDREAYRQDKEFPTYVGMNRYGRTSRHGPSRVPHVCGDEPVRMGNYSAELESSPRMWG